MNTQPGKVLRIACLSGTGNSLWLARRLAEMADTRGWVPEIVALERDADDAGEPAMWAFVFPVHAFITPWGVLRVLLEMPRGRGRSAVVLVARGAVVVGRHIIPGLEGLASWLAALVLALKGYDVRGMRGVDLPSNWLAVHPGPQPAQIARLTQRASHQLAEVAQPWLAGARAYRGWLSLALGICLLPVALGYLLFGRFFLAKLFFASERCTGCGLCARTCPFHAIRMIGTEYPRPFWTFRCQSCMRCMAYCPERAIEAGHSWAILLWLLGIRPAYAIGAALTPYAWPLGGELIGYAGSFVMMGLWSALFFFALRVPLINRLFTFTTLTRRFRRYRAPGVTAADWTSGRYDRQGAGE